MKEKLIKLGAQKTPDGLYLDLTNELYYFAFCCVYIKISLAFPENGEPYEYYSIEFEWSSLSGRNKMEINKSFTTLGSLIKCITQFKKFAKEYL